MKRGISFFTLFVFFLTFSCGIVFSQQVDLSGTWKGKTEIPDMGEDELTLVIKKEKGEYSAKISDSMGMLQETDCEDFELENNTLTLNFMVFTGEDYLRVFLTLTVSGKKMSGYWETEDGSSAPIELEKI